MRTNEQGFILVTILLVIALLFPLILAFNARVQLNLVQAANFRNSIQALRIARSGVEGAIAILKEDDPSYDAKTDKWALAFPSLAIGDGILSVSVTDEDGKLPINNLVTAVKSNQAGAAAAAAAGGQAAATGSGGATQTNAGSNAASGSSTTNAGSNAAIGSNALSSTTNTPQGGGGATQQAVDKDLDARLRSLISRLGGKPEIVDALIDWLDADDDVTGTGGAEEDYYKPLGYDCKNGPLDSLDELLLVKGFDKELLIDKNLKDYLTIAPTNGKVNLNTAPVPVLIAVLGTQTTSLPQPMSESDIQNLVQYRDEHDLKDVKDIMSAVKISQSEAGMVTPLVKVNSAYFTVHSKCTIDKVVKNVEALLKRDGTTVTIISWREF
jgi:type II secretory pathway component PulK